MDRRCSFPVLSFVTHHGRFCPEFERSFLLNVWTASNFISPPPPPPDLSVRISSMVLFVFCLRAFAFLSGACAPHTRQPPSPLPAAPLPPPPLPAPRSLSFSVLVCYSLCLPSCGGFLFPSPLLFDALRHDQHDVSAALHPTLPTSLFCFFFCFRLSLAGLSCADMLLVRIPSSLCERLCA